MIASASESDWQRRFPVTWISIERLRIGLVEMERVPPILAGILSHWIDRYEKPPFEILLFPSKESTERFFLPLTRESYPEVKGSPFRPTASGSRYFFVIDQSTGSATAALNTGAIEPTFVGFLLDFLGELLTSMNFDIRPMIQEAATAVTDAFLNYNVKFGLLYVANSSYTILMPRMILENLRYAFAYFSAMRRIVSSENSRIVADFLQERLDMPFQLIDWEDVDVFTEVLGILWRYMEATNTLKAVSHIPVLHQLLSDQHQRNVRKLKARLGTYQDIISALDFLSHRLDTTNYSSRDEFIKSCCKAFAEASHLLAPRYMRLDEIAELSMEATKHLDAIEHGTALVSRFGSRRDLMNILERIFYKEGVYPEIPVLAGNALLQLLESLVFTNSDFLAYRQALVVGRRLSMLIDRDLTEIQRIDRPLGEVRGTPLNEREVILPLLGLAACARFFDDIAEAKRLERDSREFLKKHEVPDVSIIMDWRVFLESHDIQALQRIYKEFEVRERGENLAIEPLVSLVGHLASAFFEDSQRDSHLQIARQMALDLELETESPVSIRRSQHQMMVSTYLVDLLDAVFAIATKGPTGENLRRAKISAAILSDELAPKDQANSIVIRTQSLCALLEGNHEIMKSKLISLKTRFNSRELSDFVEICASSLQRGLLKRRVLTILENKTDLRDPWNAAALQYMNSELASQLRRAELLDYDSIVFVEGSDDRKIFKKWACKIVPNLTILFIDTEGWTNMEFFANARVVAELHKPLFVVFDGDTNRDRVRSVKERLVGRLSLEPHKIITLSRNSIEAYLLNPRSIKAAFPQIRLGDREITSFLQRMIKKQNKKSVLDLLLREHLGKKYDGSAGARIATHMRRSEIETEILQLFARISLAAAKRSINADFNSRNEISEMLSARASKPNTTIIGANAH